MECQCEKDNSGEAVQGWWMGTSNVQIGAFTVVGYLLYRFSQTLPALIRWPIRIFCSLTGLSALWSWVGRLVGTIRGIQNLFKCLSQVWRFIIRISHKFKWLSAIIKVITGSSGDEAQGSEGKGRPTDSGLRLILLGSTAGEARTSLANTLLGSTGIKSPMGPRMESTKWTAVVDGRDVTVIDTPDLLGPSLGNSRRAKEALRSLQLVSPGPHAVLLVMQSSSSSRGINQDATRAIQATVELFGDEVLGHIIPVLTHTDRLGRQRTVDELLDVDADLRRAVSLCGQRPELVDDRPDCPPEAQRETSRQLVGRVMEMKELRGHFVHELQRREERFREELLTDMASVLARKLGHM